MRGHPRGRGATHNEDEVIACRGPVIPEPLEDGEEIRFGRVEPGHLIEKDYFLLASG